ncbi:MAG: ABC transporter ATP-binding protein [Bacillota bacterium]|nr:ABC transporter ATP-binding protein [Bacillota bacterium]
MKKTVIKTKDLCKTYVSDGEQFHAIRNLSLEIYEGDFTVIMGSSGSGKSTLLYLLSGLDNVTTGDVWFSDIKIDSLKEKEIANFRRMNIGFIFQAINLVPNLTIFENITIPGYLANKNKKLVDQKAYELLKMFELHELSGRLPSQVSGGQQQRVAIARGLINSPQVLFADEPTGSLNSAQGRNVLDILTNINEGGQTVVMVTHDFKAACRADRILFIRDGKIDGDLELEKFTTDNLEQREEKVFAYLTEKGW